jgi:F0F1-type ATP synthase membrane subunit c/vacuolar-type H+-ATPase subunit K
MATNGGTPTLQAARLLWGSFLAALVIYAFFATYVVRPVGGGPERMGSILMLLAVATGAAALVMHRRLPDARSGRWPDDPTAAQALFTRYMVVWALAEAIGLFGLVLRFLGGDGSTALGFVAASAALLVYTRPQV